MNSGLYITNKYDHDVKQREKWPFCRVMDGSDFEIRKASAFDSFVRSTLHQEFMWSRTPR